MIRLVVVDAQLGVRGLDAEQRLGDDVGRVVDQLLHWIGSFECVAGQAGLVGSTARGRVRCRGVGAWSAEIAT